MTGVRLRLSVRRSLRAPHRRRGASRLSEEPDARPDDRSTFPAAVPGPGDRRIDFLFAKAYTASGTGTVDYGQAYDASGGLGARAPKYSDHRGQGAALKYY
ncbi:hypothetical protein ACFQZ4_04425 [Catellatospora coxensis]|uniref:Uncharacterized protein n=1 Tax=Catellatospora coxensis TaxID=310354 RepID=A0A8J3P7C6_9ACTN|nr:hypothetical protein [Catellatospora coxensis]GIG06258.1 hypothetical protein Cco03nite_29580 [Catellatospora coxensis]